jgi:hypothetical protein
MSCADCPHCIAMGKAGHLTPYEQSVLADRVCALLNLSDLDLEDRGPHRPSAFRMQLAMYILVEEGLSKAAVSRAMMRERQVVLHAVKIIKARIAGSAMFARSIDNLVAQLKAAGGKVAA